MVVVRVSKALGGSEWCNAYQKSFAGRVGYMTNGHGFWYGVSMTGSVMKLYAEDGIETKTKRLEFTQMLYRQKLQ